MIYWLIGGLWILACLGLGVYITGKGYGLKISYAASIRALFLSYVLGLAFLVAILITSV